MALLGYQTPARAGTAVNFVACSAGGDKIPARSRGLTLVKNASGGALTVTVAVPGTDAYGSARPDFNVVVPAGATVAMPPFPSDLVDPSDGLVHLSYSGVGSLSIAAIAA